MRDLRGLSLEERMNELKQGVCVFSRESKQRVDSFNVKANVDVPLRRVDFDIKTERKGFASIYMTFSYAIANQDEGTFRTEEEYKDYLDYSSAFIYTFYSKYLGVITEMGKARKIKGDKVIEDMPLMGDTYENCIFNLGVEDGELTFDFVLDNDVCNGRGTIEFGKACEKKVFEVIKLIFDFRRYLIRYMKMALYNIETLKTQEK